jgi:hypothetical protein
LLKFREVSPDMSTLEQIEAAILTLPSDEPLVNISIFL